MNKTTFLSLICLVFGIVFFAFGFLSGDIEGGIIVVFPFIAGTGIYAFLGFIFLLVAFLLFIFGFKTNVVNSEEYQEYNNKIKSNKKTSLKGGGVVLIGPIPIVFGSNWKIALILMIVAIIIIITSFLAFDF